MARQNVLYARFSSDMQNPRSCADQEREVRKGLARKAIDAINFLVINDEAESGTKSDRPGFMRLLEMIERRDIGIVAVDDQSRLSRADDAFGLIKDIVYAGGRFISIGESIDTVEQGWELKAKVLELHNATTIRELGQRVQRGQRGRVLTNHSAGDIRFGYESYLIDPNAAVDNSHRGPRPPRGIRIHPVEAEWVTKVFIWFTRDGLSIRRIADRLTSLKVPKDHRSNSGKWHHYEVRRMLSCTKFIGLWKWGTTTTIRNSKGKKRQVPVPEEKQEIVKRPELRIIDQQTWELAQEKLRKLDEIYGQKEGQKPRGPKPHHSEIYPESLLGGLIECGECGSRMWLESGGGSQKYLGCPHRGDVEGTCTMCTRVPVAKAEEALVEFVCELLEAWPEWVSSVANKTRDLIRENSSRIPTDVAAAESELVEIDRKIGFYVKALADPTFDSPSVKAELMKLETRKRQLHDQIEAGCKVLDMPLALPTDEWIRAQLADLVEVLRERSNKAALLLRALLGKVTAFAEIPRGKKRGYSQLRFRINGWEALRAILGEHMPQSMLMLLSSSPELVSETSPEFRLDLGKPTRRDELGPQIAAWREQKITWEEICHRTGLGLGSAYGAWKTFLSGT